MTVDRAAVEKLLYVEAEFLDSNQFDNWLALWADEATYWVPCNEYDIDPSKHVSLIYDDKASLQARIERLKSEAAWSQNPRSRLRRLISNIVCEENSASELTVCSNFILHDLRRHVMTTWTGRTIHNLRLIDGNLKIAAKKVLLLNNDEFMPNLPILL